MLYHLVSRSILPTHAGGLEVEVIFIDTDYHFDMLRLVSILEAHLTSVPQNTGTEEVICSSLSRLSILHCSSSVQLLLTLHSLDGIFCNRSALCLLVIDSISAFYWLDRANGGDNLARQEANLRKCVDIIERIRKDYGIVFFATTHAVMRNYSSGSAEASGSSASYRKSSDFDKPYLCRAWQKLLTHRIVFSKSDQNNVDDQKQFSLACSTIRTKGIHRRMFFLKEGGVQYIE